MIWSSQVSQLSKTDNLTISLASPAATGRCESTQDLNFSLRVSLFSFFTQLLPLNKQTTPWMSLRRACQKVCHFPHLYKDMQKSSWREIRKRVGCSQEEAVTAGCCADLWMWLFRTGINTSTLDLARLRHREPLKLSNTGSNQIVVRFVSSQCNLYPHKNIMHTCHDNINSGILTFPGTCTLTKTLDNNTQMWKQTNMVKGNWDDISQVRTQTNVPSVKTVLSTSLDRTGKLSQELLCNSGGWSYFKLWLHICIWFRPCFDSCKCFYVEMMERTFDVGIEIFNR